MSQAKQPDRGGRIKRLNGTILSVALLCVMAIALIIFVISSDHNRIDPSIALTQTATLLEGTTQSEVSEAVELAPDPLVNVNGILLMAGALVLMALIAVIREALLHRKIRDDL